LAAAAVLDSFSKCQ